MQGHQRALRVQAAAAGTCIWASKSNPMELRMGKGMSGKAMMTELDSDRDRSGEKRCVFESEVQECRRARRGGGESWDITGARHSTTKLAWTRLTPHSTLHDQGLNCREAQPRGLVPADVAAALRSENSRTALELESGVSPAHIGPSNACPGRARDHPVMEIVPNKAL